MVSKVAHSYFFLNPFQKKVYKPDSYVEWDGKAFPRRKTICIVRQNNSKEVSHMAQGVVNALMSFVEHPYIIPVVGDNNVMELTLLLHDIVRQHPEIDMIFSFGRSAMVITQKITQLFGGKIPIFFIAVDEKFASRVMQRGEGNVTGTIAPERDYIDQFKRFFSFTQPHTIKKVLLPCSRFAHGLGSAYRNEIAPALLSFLTSHGVEAEVVEVTCREELRTKIKPLLSTVGLITIPRDTVLETYIDEFIEMANERQIPLFSSSFEAVEEGAATGFGLYDHTRFGKQNASLAKPILMHDIHPSQLPPAKFNNWVGMMAINREAAAQQGLKLDMGRVCADSNVVLL